MAIGRGTRRRVYRKMGTRRGTMQYRNPLIYNPFSPRSNTPKLGDGREYMSTGIKLQCVSEIPCPVDGKCLYLAFFPGISNCIYAINGTKEGTGLGGATTYPFKNHLLVSPETSGEPAAVTGFKQAATAKIAKWRTVSAGIKLAQLNNSDENEGWFECIRYQAYPNINKEFTLAPPAGTPAPSPPYTPVVTSNTENAVPGFNAGNNGAALCEHPSYITGKLRHLNRMMFRLMSNTTDHEFINLPDFIPTAGDEGAAEVVDPAFDCLLFKIYGRSGGESTSPTKILVHVVSNQELVYDESSTLSRYMTKNLRTGGYAHRKNGDPY